MDNDQPLSPEHLFDLTGQVAVVTGASGGLGERFARVLHTAGATVIAVARRADQLNRLADGHDRIVPVVADLTVPEQIESIVPAALDRFGRLDILVNNAGVGNNVRALDHALADFRYTVELNLIAVFNLARLAAKPMIEAGSGSIINIASIFGLVSGWPFPDAAYTSSKAGVINLTRDLACQWARDGVRVNSLAPGFFPSQMTDGMEEHPQSRRFLETGCPMKRIGKISELDGAMLFLASTASTYMTGQVLTIDGGWTAH